MDINRVARGPALERVAVIVMAALIGRFWAAGLFVATSIAGALLLRRFGRGDANRIGFAHNGCQPCIWKRLRGNRARAILLIFPGFITFLPDAVFLSAVRRRAGKVRKGAQFRAHPRNGHVIELSSANGTKPRSRAPPLA
jgi:UPF0716 family protein affecting phage T7 exclusion